MANSTLAVAAVAGPSGEAQRKRKAPPADGGAAQEDPEDDPNKNAPSAEEVQRILETLDKGPDGPVAAFNAAVEEFETARAEVVEEWKANG